MAIDKILKKWSYELCLSLTEIAKESGLSTTSIYRYIYKERKPKMQAIRKLREFAKSRGLVVPEVEEFIEDEK